MSDPILKSFRKYKDNKTLVFENQERSLESNSKFVKEMLKSLNEVIKGGVIVKINSFKYTYPDYVKILGTFDGSVTWMYTVDEKSKFLIKSSEFTSLDSKKAEELKKLTIYFESESLNSQIRDALQNNSFS